MALCIYIDGGARGNPGPSAAGVVIHEGDPSKPLHEGGYFLGHMTNNMAEYKGLLIGLATAAKIDADQISVHSDSQLLVRQVQGQYRVQSPVLKPLYEQAKKLLGQFKRWQITHVRREFNQRADELANLSMDAGADVIVVPLSTARTVSAVDDSSDAAEAPVAWVAQLLAAPGPACTAASEPHHDYRFGPATPEGFCLYASEAVLEKTISSDAPPRREKCQTRCRRCGVTIAIKPLPRRLIQ